MEIDNFFVYLLWPLSLRDNIYHSGDNEIFKYQD